MFFDKNRSFNRITNYKPAFPNIYISWLLYSYPFKFRSQLNRDLAVAPTC